FYIIIFLIGFISFPLLILILFKLAKCLPDNFFKTDVPEYKEISEIRNKLNDLVNKNYSKLFIMIKENGYELIINKKEYKSKDNELQIELRFNDITRKYFDDILKGLATNDSNYTIKYSPKLKLPNRIFIKFETTAILSISPIINTLNIICKSITNNDKNPILVDFSEPYTWSNNPYSPFKK
ncbi:MAG: hypothetical protein MJB14_08645, partial [Spirochaetes bacterium]|nr:hypothetical protein [Spirochaetota bacterium]